MESINLIINIHLMSKLIKKKLKENILNQY